MREEVKMLPSGATRSAEGGKFDYEGFINPGVLFEYSKYLHKHRVQADGSFRDSDNWQKGMSNDDYMKPLLRHTMDAWLIHRGYAVYKEKAEQGEATHIGTGLELVPISWHRTSLKDSLCGIIFNASGYILNLIKGIAKNANTST